MTPTPEQEAIVAAVTNSRQPVMVRALPGTGKTTTLVMMAAVIQEPGVALAFNVDIKKELEKRFPTNFSVWTINGLGHRAWGKAIGKRLIVDTKKLGRLVTQACKTEGFQADNDQWDAIRWCVAQAMQRGLVPEKYNKPGLVPDTMETWRDIGEERQMSDGLLEIAHRVLEDSIREAYEGNISFDDQVYMSAMFHGVFPRFPNVMVDEAQDLSPLNHIMIRRTAGPDGRFFIVGDEHQAIYAFRGADSESMDKLKATRPDWIELPLATTFRCPKVIVERQHGYIPHYKAYHTNIEGEFRVLKKDWTMDGLLNGSPLAVLCRNNAPLVTLAFKLIRQNIGCYMIGRDIGKGLKALAKKIIQPEAGLEAMFCAIDDWHTTEFTKAQVKSDDAKMDKITDQAESLRAILDGSNAKLGTELFQAIEAIFAKDSGRVVLATGHKAKGLEWDTVIHLDPHRIPSRFAKTKSQLTQEYNLRLVIETRTKQRLLEATAEEYGA